MHSAKRRTALVSSVHRVVRRELTRGRRRLVENVSADHGMCRKRGHRSSTRGVSPGASFGAYFKSNRMRSMAGGALGRHSYSPRSQKVSYKPARRRGRRQIAGPARLTEASRTSRHLGVVVGHQESFAGVGHQGAGSSGPSGLCGGVGPTGAAPRHASLVGNAATWPAILSPRAKDLPARAAIRQGNACSRCCCLRSTPPQTPEGPENGPYDHANAERF